LGFIDYNGGMEVHSSLLNVVLHDQPQIKTCKSRLNVLILPTRVVSNFEQTRSAAATHPSKIIISR